MRMCDARELNRVCVCLLLYSYNYSGDRYQFNHIQYIGHVVFYSNGFINVCVCLACQLLPLGTLWIDLFEWMKRDKSELNRCSWQRQIIDHHYHWNETATTITLSVAVSRRRIALHHIRYTTNFVHDDEDGNRRRETGGNRETVNECVAYGIKKRKENTACDQHQRRRRRRTTTADGDFEEV